MYVTWKVLNFRRLHSDLFLDGDYIPLHVTAPRQDHIIAFARRLQGQCCVVAVPRLLAKLTRPGSPPLGEKIWQDTEIELPPGMPAHWTNVLTNEELSLPLRVSALFSALPLSVVSG